MQNFARNLRKGNNLWWIAAFSVLGFFVCVGAALIVRYFISPPVTTLPAVPAYVYSTPTPVETIISAPQGTLSPMETPAAQIPTPLPSATATSFSFFNWIFPNRVPTTIPYNPSPTPIQAGVITLTPASSTIPSPSPQITPNPKTCRNILYPARPGSQWTYYVSTPKRSGDVTMRVTSIQGSQATIEATELNTQSTAQTYVQCDQDVILNFPLLSGQKILGDMINGAMNVDYVSGVLAPNEAAFTSSNWALSWIIQYRIYGSGMMNYNGTDFNVNLSPSNIQMTCQTLGAGNASFETITVAAGTFNALKVVCVGQGQAIATVNGSAVTGTITAQSTQWFAPNIGMLKLQSDQAYLSVFGVTIPLSSSNVAGYLELKSYAIGQ